MRSRIPHMTDEQRCLEKEFREKAKALSARVRKMERDIPKRLILAVDIMPDEVIRVNEIMPIYEENASRVRAFRLQYELEVIDADGQVVAMNQNNIGASWNKVFIPVGAEKDKRRDIGLFISGVRPNKRGELVIRKNANKLSLAGLSDIRVTRLDGETRLLLQDSCFEDNFLRPYRDDTVETQQSILCDTNGFHAVLDYIKVRSEQDKRRSSYVALPYVMGLYMHYDNTMPLAVEYSKSIESEICRGYQELEYEHKQALQALSVS